MRAMQIVGGRHAGDIVGARIRRSPAWRPPTGQVPYRGQLRPMPVLQHRNDLFQVCVPGPEQDQQMVEKVC